MLFNSKEIRSFNSKPPLFPEFTVSGKQTRQIRVWQLVETLSDNGIPQLTETDIITESPSLSGYEGYSGHV